MLPFGKQIAQVDRVLPRDGNGPYRIADVLSARSAHANRLGHLISPSGSRFHRLNKRGQLKLGNQTPLIEDARSPCLD